MRTVIEKKTSNQI